jgi:hypothetical protein
MEQIQKYKELEFYFQDIDYSDIKTIEGSASLRQFISGMLSYYPWWIWLLFRIREILVNILGLVKHEKPNGLPSIKPDELSFTSGGKASFFIVRDAKEDTYWVSETLEDKHLKAYFGVVTEAVGDNLSRFHVFTSIKYRHWTGPVYFNIIRPFHHLVVSRMMRAGINN